MAARTGSVPNAIHIYDDGTLRAGDIVVADVRNPLENPASRGKPRPFVLVCRIDGHWRGMGLTTNPRYVGGLPRTPIPNPAAAGLARPGFLWGSHLTNVSVLDINRTIGVVEPSLAEAVIELAGLYGADAAALRAAACPSSDAA